MAPVLVCMICTNSVSPKQSTPPLARTRLPRDHVAVVLHHGRHDLVPLSQVVQPPRLRHKVDRLGGSSREHDLARRLGIYESAHLYGSQTIHHAPEEGRRRGRAQGGVWGQDG